MNKELLVDCISFTVSRDVINEMTNSGGPFVVKGVLQRANAKNQNGRIYPKAILEREAVKYTITPMLSSLSILQLADIHSESQVLGYGIGVILLNVGMYFVAPAIVIIKIKSRLSKN